MADLLGIATSGLGAIQKALSTTGHNIANVNTEGYSRQVADFQTLPAQRLGDSYLGSGVEIGNVRRAYDSFVVDELRTRSSKLGFATSFESLASSMDKLVGDSDNGLAPAMEGFFNSVQGVASDPSSLSARQILLSDAQILTDRFTQLNASLLGFERDANSRITSAVGEINGLVENIAELNGDIVLALGSGGLPNDLLDQRDTLLMQLSEKVGIKTIEQTDGAINVFIGKGQPMVVGGTARQLVVVDSPVYPGRLDVGVAQPGGSTQLISNQLSGGELPGVMEFRTRVLDPAIAELGRLATGLTDLMNAQHNLGVDLNGQLGGDFFSTISPSISPSTNNTGGATISLNIDNVSNLEASDYLLVYDGAQWGLTRTSDGAFSSGAGPFVLDGITVSIAGAAPAAGDTFLLRPVHGAAGQFGLELSAADQVAAGAPVTSSLSLSNTGSAGVADLTVSTPAGLPVPTVTLTFDAALNVYNVAGGPGGTVAFTPATDSGGVTRSFPTLGGLSFTLSGIPNDGDVITLGPNTGSPGDNRNALLLGGMQSQALLDGSSATFGEAYSGMIGGVGVATRQAQANLQAEDSLMDNAIATRERISGVNLEQEAAELVRLQQAYQAAAQLVSITDTLFQTLLRATAR
ncbi:MAG: flagellar hook-associated protein FlgK [Gammaproteobacteria bacterium]|nr:flagellar hook-associated protein FlgK [Gammaproteobacteria bacterium]MBQ0839513.1 flagellar hook-associated protein FlgK [Gammaproteobacteria bacterium]